MRWDLNWKVDQSWKYDQGLGRRMRKYTSFYRLGGRAHNKADAYESEGGGGYC